MKAKDIKPLLVIDASRIADERFNQLLEVVQRQEQEIEFLRRQVGRCHCPQCVVAG